MFDFWRLESDNLIAMRWMRRFADIADKAAKNNIILILETNMNATPGPGAEAARTWLQFRQRIS